MEEDVMESTEVDTPESSVEVTEEPSGEAYTVKVDGEEQEVSLEELRDGYQRQSDYTRKTQELASERKRLQQAEAIVSSLETDPDGTLTALADAFGVQMGSPQKQSSNDSYSDSMWDEPQSDPTEQRIAQLETQLAQQARLQRRQQVEKQVEGLREQYGEFDEALKLAEKAQRSFGLAALEATDGITNIIGRLRPLGVSLKDIETTYFGFNTAATMAGVSAVEASGAFRQLAQALGSGRLQGDEFRSLAEQVPTLLKPIADELGTTVGGLKKLSSEGKITSEVIIRALAKIGEEGGGNVEKIVSQSSLQRFKEFRNAMEDILTRMETGKNRQVGKNKLVNAWTNWVNNSVGAIMFLNMRSAVLQTISAFNFVNWSDNLSLIHI